MAHTIAAIDPMNLALGLLLSLLIAVAAYLAHSLSASGAVGAVLCGTIIFGLGGWAWGLLLIAFFVSSSALSHWRASAKAGLAEKFAKTARRDLAQVAANGGWAAVLVVASLFAPDRLALFAGFAGALAAVNADTWATELGVLNSRPPRLISSGRIVAVGTSGAISPLGIAAAVAGALFIGVAAALLSPLAAPLSAGQAARLIAAVVAGGLGGSLFDSLLGATVQGAYWCERDGKETERRVHACGERTRLVRGWAWLNNEGVNFLCSVVGSGLAWLLWR